MNDSRTTLNREQSAAGKLSRLPNPGPDQGSSVVARTVKLKTYPTAIASYFAVVQVDIGGPEVEGGPITKTLVGDAANPFFAAHIGTKLPPEGTDVELSRVPLGRWVFRYD